MQILFRIFRKLKYICGTEKKYWFNITNAFTKNEKGEKYVLSIFRDISPRKKAEFRLIENEEKFRTISNNLSDFAYILNLKKNLDFNFEWTSIPLETTIGYSEEQLKERGFRELFYSEDLKILRKIFNALTTRNQDVSEFRIVTKDNRLLWYRNHCQSKPLDKNSKDPVLRIFGAMQDITKQKEAEESLKQSEMLYKNLIASLGEGLAVADKQERIILSNKVCADILGVSEKDLIGRSFYDFLDDENKKIIEEKGKERLRGEQGTYEIVITRPSGEKRNLLVTAGPKFNPLTGKIEGSQGIFRDITDLKIAQETLKDNEEKYSTLFNSSHVGFMLMDYKYLDCNEQACKIFGCKKEDIIGKYPIHFSPELQPNGESSARLSNKKIEMALKGIPQTFYWKHKKLDDTQIDTEVNLTPVSIHGKKLIQLSITDISQRIRTEKVRDAMYKISEAANSSDEIKSLYQRIHEIVSYLMPANNFYIALYDEQEDLISFPYFVDEVDTAPPPKKPGNGLTEYVIRKGEDIIVDWKKDLELREKGEVELVGEPQAVWLGISLKLEGKTFGVMVLQDYKDEKAYGEAEKQILIFVSEQIAQAIDRKRTQIKLKSYMEELEINKNLLENRAEELAQLNSQLLESERQLKELNINKDKFFSIIAHDLRSPFTALLGYSQFLVDEIFNLSYDEIKEFTSNINKSAKRVFNLLENLLHWARLQSGRVEFTPAAYNLRSLFEDLLGLYQTTAEKKRIQFSKIYGEHIEIFADKNMLNTILRNLISNAIKFTAAGGYVKIITEKDNEYAKITIEDSGIGISSDDLNKLFKIEEHVTRDGTESEKGTGLGLILCKEFVEKNGGQIWVESNTTGPNRGSKFIFTLTLA